MTNSNLDSQLSKLRIDKSKKRPRRTSARWSWLVILVLVAVAAFGGYRKMYGPIQVRTARVEQEALVPGKGPALVTASGYVVPRHKVEISSKVIGRINEAMVKRGDRVEKGSILLKIEDDDFQARVLSSEAQVATLRARVAELRAGSRPQEIEAAEAAVASAEATLRNAQLDVQRLEALERQRAAARQEVDRAITARDVAQARLESERKNTELVKIGPRREQVEAAEAQLREAEANLELAKTELDYTVIRAPMSGTILEKLAEQGELVTNTNFGGTRGAKNSVVSMADLSDLQVEVDLNEVELSKVKLGQQTEIRLDSNPQRVYAGEVDEISPQADRQKGSVQVKVRIIEPDESIKTEVNARVTFLGDPVTPGQDGTGQVRLWIPKSAVVQGREGASVYVLSDGKATRKPVTLGAEGEKGLEIINGLVDTDTIIMAPIERLSDGARVAAMP